MLHHTLELQLYFSLTGADVKLQVSTVASESAFSGAGRVVDPFRNRLDPEMIEALVCSKDWIHARTKGIIFLNCSIKFNCPNMLLLYVVHVPIIN
jgi:hypothetical protein